MAKSRAYERTNAGVAEAVAPFVTIAASVNASASASMVRRGDTVMDRGGSRDVVREQRCGSGSDDEWDGANDADGGGAYGGAWMA